MTKHRILESGFRE